MIKKRYNITIECYNNIVKEITFTGKRDEKNIIVVVFRRSDMKPVVFHSQDFIDLEFKNNFIGIAKSLVVWHRMT
jgi:hypothetical protein